MFVTVFGDPTRLVSPSLNKKILVDCGMFQGLDLDARSLNKEFGFDPKSIDYLILSHAHIDHSGLIPKIVKDGFKGPVYCTIATYDLCSIMLMDSAMIQEADARFLNKKNQEMTKQNLENAMPLASLNLTF